MDAFEFRQDNHTELHQHPKTPRFPITGLWLMNKKKWASHCGTISLGTIIWDGLLARLDRERQPFTTWGGCL